MLMSPLLPMASLMRYRSISARNDNLGVNAYCRPKPDFQLAARSLGFGC
jgi:hypothetical protein